jgi:hypothetical protein
MADESELAGLDPFDLLAPRRRRTRAAVDDAVTD